MSYCDTPIAQSNRKRNEKKDQCISKAQTKGENKIKKRGGMKITGSK
jgi:hypothetical protein